MQCGCSPQDVSRVAMSSLGLALAASPALALRSASATGAHGRCPQSPTSSGGCASAGASASSGKFSAGGGRSPHRRAAVAAKSSLARQPPWFPAKGCCPNPSLDGDCHRQGTWPARGRVIIRRGPSAFPASALSSNVRPHRTPLQSTRPELRTVCLRPCGRPCIEGCERRHDHPQMPFRSETIPVVHAVPPAVPSLSRSRQNQRFVVELAVHGALFGLLCTRWRRSCKATLARPFELSSVESGARASLEPADGRTAARTYRGSSNSRCSIVPNSRAQARECRPNPSLEWTRSGMALGPRGGVHIIHRAGQRHACAPLSSNVRQHQEHRWCSPTPARQL